MIFVKVRNKKNVYLLGGCSIRAKFQRGKLFYHLSCIRISTIIHGSKHVVIINKQAFNEKSAVPYWQEFTFMTSFHNRIKGRD